MFNHSNKIIEQLSKKLSAYYNVEREIVIHNREIDLLAQSNQKLQHYALNKKIVLDESNLNDYLVFQKEASVPTKEILDDHYTWLKEWAKSKVSSGNQNMRSRFILLLLLEENWLPPKFEQVVKKYAQSFWHKFGLNGWYDTILICYHLPSFAVYAHRKGKDFFDLLKNSSSPDLPELTTKENEI